MIDSNMLLGNGAYANVDHTENASIWNPNKTPNIAHIINNLSDDAYHIADTDPATGSGACINGTVSGTTYTGIVAGALVDASDNGITTLDSGVAGYFFYSGTAPAPTIISFELTP